MTVAGVDVGLKYTKIVIMRHGEVIGKAIGTSGGLRRAEAVEMLWKEALDSAGLSASDIDKVVSTGQGKMDVAFADKRVVESVADARGARFIDPLATSVVDCGADQTRVITLGEGDAIEEVVLNQKCMAGMGLLVERMAGRLELTFEQMSALEKDAGAGNAVNDGCPVFAELDALEMLNRNVPVTEVAGAVTDIIAVRLNSILNDKIRPEKKSTVLMGGLAKNRAVVGRLESRSGIDFIIPENAEFGCAIGAAVIASKMT